ncbi:ABC transporter ATP-binding protein [Kallotenue papyrolyticum]|uniref:ABC transporter ATP-binding protein n=1 Tax=Kallotenue papyrolyticum TaxID=1325125 RepID=UPI0004926456|nr:ABC transporter ATP-binding protein [Kallotenue papyrolyticum]
MSEAVIDVNNLHKRYGTIVAVDDISFSVGAGEIFGIVGPNGAGKTTVVECIEGLRRPDRGTVRVLGLNPIRDRRQLYQQVGVQLQENGGLHPRQKVGEVFRIFASLYADPEPIDTIIAKCGLRGRENDYNSKLSGGQKRRLLLGLALLCKPKLLILDEPTSGLDPQARYNIWQLLSEYRERGTTVLLTTHYLDEAQEHCDTLCVIDHGTVIALGAPRALLRQHQLDVCAKLPTSADIDLGQLARMPSITRVERVNGHVVIYGSGNDFVQTVSQVAQLYGISQHAIETRPAKLEDLYLLLTGRAYRQEA